jgi:predicted enzyme related to lactoylglutathione lyase
MKRTPRPQRFKDGAESLAVGRYLIRHLKRWFLPHGSGYQPLTFQFAQLLPQNFDRHSGHSPSKSPKPEGALTEAAKNHRLPPTLNHADRRIERTVIAFNVARLVLSHGDASWQTGYFKVPACQSVRAAVHSSYMASARLFRVIVPVSSINDAAAYYSAVLEQPGIRISPGRHYFDCGGTILACFDPRADGDAWDAAPNPDHVYFAVDDLESYHARVGKQPNGSILRSIETQPWGERSFYCADPFGNKLCFVDERTLFTGR